MSSGCNGTRIAEHAETAVSSTPEPTRETATSGHVCGFCGRVHPLGRFMLGCTGPRLKDARHSALVRSGAATGTEHVLAARRVELHQQLGDVGVVKAELADSFLELSAVRAYLGARLGAEGPLTAKGRTRALLSAYLNVADRIVTLAKALGVERKPRPVDMQARVNELLATRQAERDQLAKPDGGADR